MALMTRYGYVPTYKPPKPPSLAHAAASDPYGLAPNNRPGPLGANPLGLAAGRGFAAASHTAATPAYGGRSPDVRGGSAESYPNAPAAPAPPQTPPAAADVNKYDLNTDPALQQIQALVGLSDEQAQAQALKERQNLLLSYGDPNAAAAVLGQNDPIVAAARGNPTSTVAQLGQQRDHNLHDLTEALNQNNLAYSGYRVTQEQQAGQDYQNALAQAAAGLNSNLDQVSGNLNSALASSAAQRAQAISDAERRAAEAAAAGGGGGGGGTGGTDPGAGGGGTTTGGTDGGGGGGGGGTGAGGSGGGGDAKGASYTDPVTQALIDAGLARRQGFLNYGLRSSF